MSGGKATGHNSSVFPAERGKNNWVGVLKWKIKVSRDGFKARWRIRSLKICTVHLCWKEKLFCD